MVKIWADPIGTTETTNKKGHDVKRLLWWVSEWVAISTLSTSCVCVCVLWLYKYGLACIHDIFIFENLWIDLWDRLITILACFFHLFKKMNEWCLTIKKSKKWVNEFLLTEPWSTSASIFYFIFLLLLKIIKHHLHIKIIHWPFITNENHRLKYNKSFFPFTLLFDKLVKMNKMIDDQKDDDCEYENDLQGDRWWWWQQD